MSACVTKAQCNLRDSTCTIQCLDSFPDSAFLLLGDLEQGHFTALCFNLAICKLESCNTYLPWKAAWWLEMGSAM